MKKQELLHMHALFVEIAEQVTAEGSAASIPAYAASSVRPTSLHRPKADHEAAVMTLADGIAEEIGADRRKAAVRA